MLSLLSSPGNGVKAARCAVANNLLVLVALTVAIVAASPVLAAGLPNVKEIEPAKGRMAGGNEVKIAGDHFTNVSSVAFGANPATRFDVLSDTEIVATVPAGEAGLVDVSVTNMVGTGTLEDGYTYLRIIKIEEPEVTSIDPERGPLAGGTRVLVSGKGLYSIRAVSFGANAAEVGEVAQDGTSFTVTAPAGAAAGAVDVTVVAAGLLIDKVGDLDDALDGDLIDRDSYRTIVLDDAFTYVDDGSTPAAPVITSIDPNHGPLAGGNEVVIVGQNLDANCEVFFGDASTMSTAILLPNDDGTHLTVAVPAGAAAGAVDVQVVSRAGEDKLSGGYTYDASTDVPEVTSIEPANGPIAGGNIVVVLGRHLDLVTDVYFGDTAGEIVRRILDIDPIGIDGERDGVAEPVDENDEPLGDPLPLFGGRMRVRVPAAREAGAVDVRFLSRGNPDTVVARGYTYDDSPFALDPNAPLSIAGGYMAGGVQVTITGAGLNNVTGVLFGGVAATIISVGADGTTLVIELPEASAPGAVDVVLICDGFSLSLPGAFTYWAPDMDFGGGGSSPLSITSAYITGGATITITGSNLDYLTSVTFGGVAGTLGPATDGGTQRTVTIPVMAAPGNVAVVLSNGHQNYTVPGGFTFWAPDMSFGGSPLSATSGDMGGNNSLTITGQNMQYVVSVSIGGNNAAITSQTSTAVTVTVPPASNPGHVDVTLFNGHQTVNVGDGYTYNAPTVTLNGTTPLSVSSGPMTGAGTAVIHGVNLQYVTGVTFGTQAATNLTPNGDGTQLTVTIPNAIMPGNVTVTVSTISQSVTVSGGFTYLPPDMTFPASPLSSTSGSMAGGNSITIDGTAMNFVTEVRFGANAANITNKTATQVTVTVPDASAPGHVDVSVSNGNQALVVGSGYDYQPLPLTLDATTPLSDNNGDISGGNDTIINGTNLQWVAVVGSVTFGGAAATNLSANPAGTQLTVRVPAAPGGSAGNVPVVVSNGSMSAEISGGYIYQPHVPVIDTITPNHGSQAGGDPITITGSNFDAALVHVRMGGVEATGMTVTNAGSTINAITPSIGTTGLVDIEVDVGFGIVGVKTGAFTFDAVPTPSITNVQPSTGSRLGNTQVVITVGGLDLTQGPVSVTFGGNAATVVGTPSAGSVTVRTPAAAADGPVMITVSVAGLTASWSGGFTYTVPPPLAVVTSMNPTSAPMVGGTPVTFTGSNFTGASQVMFGNLIAQNLVVIGDSTITVVTPPATVAGVVSVEVTTPGGTAVAPVTFEFFDPALTPSISSVSPNKGISGVATAVTISGTNLAGAIAVTFGGQAGSNLVATATQITVSTPALAVTGAVDVTVMTATGSFTMTNGFTYEAPSASNVRSGFNSVSGCAVSDTSMPWLALATFALTIAGALRLRRRAS